MEGGVDHSPVYEEQQDERGEVGRRDVGLLLEAEEDDDDDETRHGVVALSKQTQR